jgi:hypothetical protein
MELNAAKKETVNHLIAAHEGRPWGSRLSKYFRAFSGAFSPDMDFTFYFVTETRPVMYMSIPGLRISGVPARRSTRSAPGKSQSPSSVHYRCVHGEPDTERVRRLRSLNKVGAGAVLHRKLSIITARSSQNGNGGKIAAQISRFG